MQSRALKNYLLWPALIGYGASAPIYLIGACVLAGSGVIEGVLYLGYRELRPRRCKAMRARQGDLSKKGLDNRPNLPYYIRSFECISGSLS